MHSINVLITSAGVSSAVNVIKALRLQKEFSISIIASDADELASGLHLADYSYVSPPIKDIESYLEFLYELCRKHRINAIYPCYSKELYHISTANQDFEALGAKTLLPSPQSIELCNNKVMMHEFALREMQILKFQKYLRKKNYRI